MQKKTIVQVYREGVYIGPIINLSNIKFSKVINGGNGDLTLIVDDVDFDVEFMDRVEVSVIDKDAPNGVLVYSGFVNQIEQKITTNKTYKQIQLLGYHTLLGEVMLEDSTNYYNHVFSARTYNHIFKYIIDRYKLIHTLSPINYTTDSVYSDSVSVYDHMYGLTVLEALNREIQHMGNGFYWYNGTDNIIGLYEISSTPNHTFIFQKHFSEINVSEEVGNIINNVWFWNGLTSGDPNLISKEYYSGTSITNFWERKRKQKDGRITNTAYANTLFDTFIDNNKTIAPSLTIKIIDNNISKNNGYDIESIEAGQTCEIINIENDMITKKLFFISSVQYSYTSVVLKLQDTQQLVSRELGKIRTELTGLNYSDATVGETYSIDVD